MSPVTEQVSKYVRSKGINLAKMSRDTGVSYMALYDSLANTERKRDLRDNEFLSICGFLDVDPRYFVDKPSEKATG